MKKLLILFTLISVTFFNSCYDDDKDNNIQLENSSKNKSATNKSAQNVVSKIYTNSNYQIMMIHDRVDEEVYFMQLYSGHNLSELNADDVYFGKNNTSLLFELNDNITEYGFNQNIYGIGSIGYSSAKQDDILILDDNNIWVLNYLDDFYPEAKCGCIPNGDPFPNNCDAGGHHSSGCSVSTSNGNCSTSCDANADACCSNDNAFTYE